MSLLSAFNNVIIDFLNDCILVFPEENDFKVYKRMISLLVKVNPKKVLSVFSEYSDLYKDKIINKDEDFFLENDYDVVKKYNDQEIFNVINKIKQYWKQLDLSNKDKIWDYLNLLIQIKDKYYA
jgi:hypothetical protein